MTAAGIQLRLQRELLDPQDEQLLALVHCHGNADKKGKKKDLFVCLVNKTTQSQGFQISIAEYKGTAAAASVEDSSSTSENVALLHTTELPRKKRSWNLRELKSIDAKGIEAHFELEFDRAPNAYTWTAVNREEKNKFLSTLINLSTRHSKGHKLSVSNLPDDVIVVDSESIGDKGSRGGNNAEEWPIMNRDGGGGQGGGAAPGGCSCEGGPGG